MNWNVETASARGVLTLLAINGLGPVGVQRIGQRFRSLSELRSASPRDVASFVSANVQRELQSDAVLRKALDRADETLETAARLRVRVLTLTDEAYPEWLRTIGDAPPILYVKGTLRAGLRSVACVGTREPSRFGERVTEALTTAVVNAGWSVVSGLAVGVDAIAHEVCLKKSGHTVAVLANGLDSIYPASNRELAERIVDAGGALVSEQPFGTEAIPRTLVQRDRLQSGMSAGTIVMQTDLVGGTMHTVRFTLLQRRLLVVPRPHGAHVDEPKSRGLVALADRSGNELAAQLGASGEYGALLKEQFAHRPAALAVHGREDYEKVLLALDASCEAKQPRESGGSRQMGLFG
jgi:DNA processing protein